MSEGQEQNQNIEQQEKKEEQYVMAIVRPRKEKNSIKKSLAKIGVAFFCGGLGFGLGLICAIPFIQSYKVQDKGESGENFQSKHIAQITYNDAADMDGVVVNIAKQIGPCVVSVFNNKKVSSSDIPYYFSQQSGEVLYGFGSGIIFKEDEQFYYIMTNAHVVSGADSLAVNFLGDIKAGCELVGEDSQTDVAVVKVAKKVLSDEEQATIGIAPIGNSDLIEAGQLAVAIGTPASDALNNTVTRGIISASQRTLNLGGSKMTLIQTDAAINPGNSGGALVGPTGEVIGMNVAKTVNTEGIGFAIPMNIVKPILEDLMVNGSVKHPALGIRGVTVTEANAQLYDLPIGVYIQEVLTGGSADLAGIKAQDILIQFEGETIKEMEQLKARIAEKRVGDIVEIKVIRDGKQKTFHLQLKEMPE